MRSLLLFAAFVPSSAALAQPASSAAQAEALFKRGKDLLAQGKTPEACAAFDTSQKLDPTVTTRLNQANCREKNNQLATAWGHFLEAEREARSLTSPDAKQLQKVAGTRAAALEKRVSTLQINVPAEVTKLPGIEIWRNRDAIDLASLNVPLPIDGGTYTIAIRSLRSREWTTTISIANEKDAKSVDVPLIVEDKAPPPHTKPDPPKTTPETPETTPEVPDERPAPGPMVQPTFGGARYAAIGIGALGVGGFIFGALRGIAAQDKQSEAQALCIDPAIPCENAILATGLTYDGNDLATQANISFAVGGGLVAAAVILWFVGRPDARPADSVAITPTLGADHASLSISGAW
ncbi:MAG: hypothetical protein ACKV2T_28085 [Kofleriaceae bacterium]